MKFINNELYDIIIIGAGFTGCALAYQFSKAGLKTLVLESGHLCSGTSVACAGRVQLIESETQDYLKIVKDGFQKIASLEQELEIDLEWETPGHITLFNDDHDVYFYQKKVAQLRSIGLEAEIIDPSILRKIEPILSLGNNLGAALSTEGHVNPFNFGFGYYKAARNNSAIFLFHQEVIGFETKNRIITEVITKEAKYYGQIIILATGAWTRQVSKFLRIQIPINFTKAEAMVTEPTAKVLDHHIGTTGFYKSVHGQNRTVTLGVGQHRNGCLLISNAITPTNSINRRSTFWGMPAISTQFSKLLPSCNNLNILRTWSAPSPFSRDFLPVTGWLPQFANIYVAAAFHLAIATIPIFSEKIVSHVTDLENRSAAEFLAPFFPARFF